MLDTSFFAACILATCALPLATACGDSPPSAPTRLSAETVLRARLEFDTGEARTTGLLAFDLDGDGKDELIALERGPGAIRVWSGLSNRADAVTRNVVYGVADYALGPVRVGAWKPGREGGPAVIAVASRNEPSVDLIDVRALYLQSGTALVAHVELAARPRVLASGDLGADGKPEVAVVTLEDELLILRAGAIAERHALRDEQSTCAHFTADGRAILVGSQAARTIVRYVPTAGSKFAEDGSAKLAGLPRRIDEITGWRGVPGTRFLVAAGDDGVVWLDEKLAIERTEKVAAVPIDMSHVGSSPSRTRLTVSVHGQEASIEREDESAPFTTYGGQHPSAGVLGDFDGNGHLDVALANGDAKRISVVFANAAGGWDLAHFAKSGRSPHSIDAGDFDGDGRLDVVALCALDTTIQMHRGTESGLSAGVSQGFAERATRVRAHDLDGDGHIDIAFLRETERGVVLDAWFGDGTGRLWLRGETRPLVCAKLPGDLRITDLEQDGTLEAVITDPGESKIVVVPIVITKPGSMSFGEPQAFELDGAPLELALVSSSKGGSVLAVALTGAAPRSGWSTLRLSRTELAEMRHEPIAERARGIAVDPAGAGLAYLGGGEGPGNLSWFVRDTVTGKGLVASGSWTTGLRAYAARCGDLDGDGLGDVVVSSQNSHQVNLWLARGVAGGGSLTRLPDLGVGTGPLDLLLVDLDGDGAPEIVTACAFSDEIAVVKLR